jgi:hypothetical protein
VSDTEDDDLHGRQLVLLLLFFGTVGGGLYLLGWLTRPGFLYDKSARVCRDRGRRLLPRPFPGRAVRLVEAARAAAQAHARG